MNVYNIQHIDLLITILSWFLAQFIMHTIYTLWPAHATSCMCISRRVCPHLHLQGRLAVWSASAINVLNIFVSLGL